MLAVCDGGSTKADWKIRMEDGVLMNITTSGFNPNYNTVEQIRNVVQKELTARLKATPGGSVYYYGAGCWDPDRRQVVADALGAVFQQTKIEVSHVVAGCHIQGS